MGIETDNIGPKNVLTVKDKIALLRTKHEPMFKALGIDDAFYLPKTVYGTPAEIVMFPSEFRVGKDVYTERVSRDYISEDPSRTLYKLKFREDFNSHYPKSPFQTDVKYHVPFSDFEEVVIKKQKIDFGIPNPDEDAPFSEFMIRDLAAIMWKRPVSHKNWLNELIIKQSQKPQ